MSEINKYQLITITGTTASGKTSLAVKLAENLDTHIISADSRQVYRGMDIGTGKDLSEYQINNKIIPYHLIDICDAGENTICTNISTIFLKHTKKSFKWERLRFCVEVPDCILKQC